MLLAVAVFNTPLAALADKIVADADFVSTSADKCTDIEVNVFVKIGKLGKKSDTKNGKATLIITQIDECQGRVLLSAKAQNITLENGEFTVDNGKATLNADIQMKDQRTGNKFIVNVLVRWVANAPPVTAHVTTDVESPGLFVKLTRKVIKTIHLANASISINDGTNELIKGSSESASFMVMDTQ